MKREPDPPEVLERFHATLDLVDGIASQVGRAIGWAIERDDLKSFGREGLLDAARRFDPSRGVPFRGYAGYRVRGAIIDGVRRGSRLPRRMHERLRGLEAAALVGEGRLEDMQAPAPPGSSRADAERAFTDHLAAVATAMATGMLKDSATDDAGERVVVADADTPEEQAAKSEILGLIERAIEALPEQEQALVRRHYLSGERFDHVAAELGLSKSWASRLHARAMIRLARRLRGLAA